MQNPKTKIPVAVLGPNGAVGQRFIQLLENHPWFELKALAGSSHHIGKAYGESCNWRLASQVPEYAENLIIRPLDEDLPVKIIFSALPSDIARKAEAEYARKGHIVCSNASAYRNEADVPLVIPEVNNNHLELIEVQQKKRGWDGFIVTSPNCTTTGIAMALKPLVDTLGIGKVFVTTMQAISGAGYPGISSLDISGNVIPYISGEEDKIENETRLLLGKIDGHKKLPHPLQISAQVNRVDVLDGHTASISVQLESKASMAEIQQIFEEFLPDEITRDLPSSPKKFIHLHKTSGRPQPRLDREVDKGMAVNVGQIRPCPILDIKLTSVVHNTLRGAAGGAILNAELLFSSNLIE